MDQPTARPPASRPRFARAAAILAAATAVAGTSAFVTTALTPAAAASAGASAVAGGHHQVSVLHFTVKFSPFHPVDVGKDGEYGVGDYVVFGDDLLDAKGHVVGTEDGGGLITRVSPTGFQVAFDFTIQLRQGQIAVQGVASNAPTKRLGIVGGTGRYVGASGHIDLTENGDSANTGKLVVTLGA